MVVVVVVVMVVVAWGDSLSLFFQDVTKSTLGGEVVIVEIHQLLGKDSQEIEAHENHERNEEHIPHLELFVRNMHIAKPNSGGGNVHEPVSIFQWKLSVGATLVIKLLAQGQHKYPKKGCAQPKQHSERAMNKTLPFEA